MNTKELIIQIIKEDMRFYQFISTLETVGIEFYDFDLNFMEIVASLLQLQDKGHSDAWINLYITEIRRSENVPFLPLGENLYPLAEACYNILLKFKNHDNDDVGGAISWI